MFIEGFLKPIEGFIYRGFKDLTEMHACGIKYHTVYDAAGINDCTKHNTSNTIAQSARVVADAAPKEQFNPAYFQELMFILHILYFKLRTLVQI